MRISDGRKLANDIMAAVLQMFQTMCEYTQLGSGVPVPQAGRVTAQGSTKVFASQ